MRDDLGLPGNHFCRFVVQTSGNVGVGTSSPSAELEISGNVKFTSGSGGSITYSDGTVQNAAFTGVVIDLVNSNELWLPGGQNHGTSDGEKDFRTAHIHGGSCRGLFDVQARRIASENSEERAAEPGGSLASELETASTSERED
jgi:hypothetical protein